MALSTERKSEIVGDFKRGAADTVRIELTYPAIGQGLRVDRIVPLQLTTDVFCIPAIFMFLNCFDN